MSEQADVVEKYDNESLINDVQISALNECGYDISREYTNEQLAQFVQAETLKSIQSIKKMLLTFGIIAGLVFLVSIITLIGALLQI